MMLKKTSGQVSVEYLIISVFAFTVIIIIFAGAILTTSQNIRVQQTGESLNSLVQKIDLVYARGPGNLDFAEVIWPEEVTGLSVIYMCKSSAELAGCPAIGGQATDCGSNNNCIKSSAIKLASTINRYTELIYPSKAKIKIPEAQTTNFAGTNLPRNARYRIKISWTETGFIKLELPS